MTGGDPDVDFTAEPTADTFFREPGLDSTWQAGPSLPAPRMSHAMASDSTGAVYAIAGSDASGFTNTVFRLAHGAGAWTTVAPLPVALDSAAAATGPDGRIWVVGGKSLDGQGCCVTRARHARR